MCEVVDKMSSNQKLQWWLKRPISTPVCALMVVLAYFAGHMRAKGSCGNVPGPLVGRQGGSTWGSIDQVVAVPANHQPDANGEFIMKKVLVPNGQVPHLTGLSRAILKPQQVVERHTHKSMHEVFYVMEGRARFMTGRGKGEGHELGAGHYIHLPPGEAHSVVNEGAEDVVLLYLGVATSG